MRLFLDFINVSLTLADLVKHASAPNAYTLLESFDQDQGCQLALVADLIVFLSEELLRQRPQSVRAVVGRVQRLSISTGHPWELDVDHHHSLSLRTRRVVLATGSAPIQPSPPLPIPLLDLDLLLSPSRLRDFLNPTHSYKLAIVGSSHSAMLALKNVTEIAPHIPLLHLFRSPLRFAQPRQGWILYDNTGLKGSVADWARDVYSSLPQIQRVKLSGQVEEEQEIYRRVMRDTTHIVYAIGYRAHSYPEVVVDGQVKALVPDPLSGRLLGPSLSLFGCGIAFPERVMDPEGHVEFAVGMWKFMRFVKRVTRLWISQESDE